MIGIPLGLLYANAGEWFIHKYVLHGLGKSRDSTWSFHFHDHHKTVRREDGGDPDYTRWPQGLDPHGKELLGLVGLAAAHVPLMPVAPLFTGAVIYSTYNYYRAHKRSHLDPEWGRKHLPWHMDHHLGPNPHANWCVTRPWFDHIMGTREPYLGTEREARDNARRAARKAKRDAAIPTAPSAHGAPPHSEDNAPRAA